MQNSNSRSLRLATALGVPPRSEAVLPTRIPIPLCQLSPALPNPAWKALPLEQRGGGGVGPA